MEGVIKVVLVLWFNTISAALAGFPFLNLEKECRSMRPVSLNSRPRYSNIYETPFRIEVSDTIYGLMHHVRVTVVKEEAKPILGVFIQARLTECANDNDLRPHGEFELLPSDSVLEFVNCDNGRRNAVINKKYGIPHDKVPVNFSIDPNEKRRLHFIATVITLSNEVWMDVSSTSIRHVSHPVKDMDKNCSRFARHRNDFNGSDVTSSSVINVLILIAMVILLEK